MIEETQEAVIKREELEKREDSEEAISREETDSSEVIFIKNLLVPFNFTKTSIAYA